MTKLKELLSELGAFVEIKNDIKNNLMLTQEYRKRQTELSGDLAKYNSIEKDTISVGLFKKVNKKEMIAETEGKLDEVSRGSNKGNQKPRRPPSDESHHLPPLELLGVP